MKMVVIPTPFTLNAESRSFELIKGRETSFSEHKKDVKMPIAMVIELLNFFSMLFSNIC